MSGPDAVPVHRIEGRTRLRIRAPSDDPGYYDRLAEELPRCPGLVAVRITPRTGSVLLEHDAPLEAIGRFAATRGLFELDLEPREHVPPLARIYDQLRSIDRGMRERTESEWDLETFAFFGLLGAGLYQVARGSVLPAGLTLLVQAAQLMAEVGATRGRG